MQYFVEIIKALAWPIATIWLGFIFRAEIRALFGRLSEVQYKDAVAKFDKTLTDAESALAKVSTQETRTLETVTALDQLRRIAETSPRAAIMEAWIMIETTAMSVGLVAGATMPRTQPRMIIDQLVGSGKLPPDGVRLIDSLRALRNQAAHLPDFSITAQEADRYLEIAAKSVEILKLAQPKA